MKIYLNTFIVLLMAKFNISSYAEAAGLYIIISQAENDGLFQILGYEGIAMILGEQYDRQGIDLKELIEYVNDINDNPTKIMQSIKVGGKA